MRSWYKIILHKTISKLSAQFLTAAVVEIQKKSVITYATFGYLRLRVNYGVITDAVITDFITLEPCLGPFLLTFFVKVGVPRYRYLGT